MKVKMNKMIHKKNNCLTDYRNCDILFLENKKARS